ncbi:protein slender lobes [Anopheles arabiensis]|uniref:protein slender lobes n=1 Tax=Anopheles arabiensis TaxID=7173 RepID=UPI001AAD882A|nr:protein slender lobes [Anopheles arabiensis]
MNQDEEVPTRVTRGALRRRSVDQEATPQKPAGAATGGTPKKSASTTKKVNALNAIQETEGRPSTPTVGRNTRRRMSETSDTPTILPNKLVQYLKEAEIGAEPGRRSRNTSLTEENLNELNAAYEGGSSVMPTRSRTPARLRASNEALTSMNSPQPAVRRSTRRNSVTSDDGSVQSLPVTTPKLTSGLRVLKDDTIIEEDASDDRAESVSSEASTRTTRRQSTVAKKSASPSPRRTAESPVSSVKTDATPPRAMKTPRVSLSPLMLPKGSPRSKNVSFCDDSKQDDSHSSFPKTPTSVSKEVVIVVNDLRNSDLKGLSPKVDREVNLPGKSEPTGDQMKSSPKSPKSVNLVGDSVPEMKANDESCSIAASPKPGKDTIEQPNSTSKDKMNSSSTVLIDNGTEAIDSSNNVSGIELLDSSVVEISDSIMEANTSVKDTSSVANKSTSEGEKLSQSWSQSVRRSATKGIDEFSVRKQEEQERLEEETEKLQKAPLKSPLKPRSPAAKAASADESIDEDNDDELENEEEAQDKNELLDDEAVEMEGYESGDSLASDLRREMEENEIMDQGEDLGSEDTEENDEQEEDEEDGNDSWIVSSGDEAEQLNEDELLKDTEDEDLQTKNASLKDEKKTKTPKRRRIIEMVDDSDEDTKASDEERKETAKSPKNLSSKRSLTPVGGKENNTPTKKLNLSQINDAVQNKNQDKLVNNTPDKNDTSMESSTDEQQVGNGNETMLPATPAHKTPSKDTGAALHSATKSLSNSKHGNGEKEVAAEDDENDTSGNSETMFQDAEDGGETVQKSDDAMEKDVSLSKSPTKSVIASRKSFPAASITTKDVIGRKSLPANGHMQAAIQSETDEGGESSQPDATQNDEVAEAEALVENVEVENAEHDDKTQAEPAPAEFTMDQPADEAPTKPGRKSMPAVPLISAQFYIGASKKRATIGGEDAHVQTSTPKSNQSLSGKDKGKKTPVEKKATTANGGSTVLNPFAQAKNKARLSLDSGAGQQKPEKKDKLRRSLPSQFVEESMDVDEAPMNENVAEEPSKPDDDKDMMDEVEVVENQEPENGKQQSKAPKPKRKALEDYDLANILSRCNEVIREDKERKKEVASAIRKKKEEKKRLRELEKQEELEASKAAAAAAAAAAAGSGGTTNGDDGGLNSSTTGNDSLSQGGEGLKKKKKRKPKVKNYLLDELAETRKERLEQALRHKLEVIERRKQRKKERQLEQQKQLDKENGNATGASGGIGAKLEKIKKKQKAKSNQESSDKSKNPPVRVALSAFAVFNQLQNHPEQVQSLEDKTQKSEKSELMAPAVEKKQHKKSPKKEEASDPQPEAKEAAKTDKAAVADEKAKQATTLKDSEQTKKKKRTERQLDGSDPSFSDEKISSTDVVVAAVTKKATPAVQTQSESSAVKSDSKINPLLSKSASDGLVQEVEKLTKKQKRKLAAMETTPTNPQKDVTPEGVPAKEMKASSFEEAQTNSVGAKRKEKMRNQTMVESDTVPKQKKSKKQSTQNGHAEDHSSNLAGAKSAFAMHENHTDGQEVVEKKKKKAKKHHAVQPEIDTDQDHSTVEQSRKKTAILERESTTTASAVPTKKRKREQTDSPAATVASTPRPAKHTKLRVLQRIESGGFFEENVTPDKIRLKRNFGFQEQQATPAKQLGFRVSSLLPTDQNELRAVASSSKTHSKDGRMKSKLGGSVLSGPPSRSLPLPVWTSSGVFIESSVDDSNGNTDGKQRKQQQGSNHKTDTGYIQLKGPGKADFRLKTLRPGSAAEKPHRVDSSTTEQSVLNFKRKQLLEKTAHLREKKSNRV